ncbi:hypothetical protein VKT23_014754 [Stygiomarasmius scandens]|uniref:Uncharacterized protein n=1 Tax=Marasmiellus scandens TaxID=2682957 RepID=A0ABR1J303_9AGAR
MSANTPPTNKPKQSWVKKMIAPFSGRKHRKNSANIAAGASQPNLMMGGEGGLLGESRASSSGISTASEPTQVLQGQMTDQVPTQGQSAQHSVGPDVTAAEVSALGPMAVIGSSTQAQTTSQLLEQTTNVQAPATEVQVMEPDYNYFKLAGTVLEKSVYTLKNFSELIPVPGLGPAVNAVCACIEHFHKISDNKEKLEELTSELASKSQALQKHWSQNMSPEMDEEYRKLAE